MGTAIDFRSSGTKESIPSVGTSPLFLEKLREGFDLVIGNRLKGRIKPGAMRPLHRYVGNPLFQVGQVDLGSKLKTTF